MSFYANNMSTGYQIYDQKAVYFVTFTIVDWVDIFSRKTYRDIIIDSLRYCCAEKGLQVFAYVVMTNHVHLIIKSGAAIPLSDIIRDFKKFTARKCLEAIQNEPESRREWLLHRFKYNAAKNQRNSNNQVWTHENHAVEIHSNEFFEQRIRYIHENPVRAGWVNFAEDYVYSSAYEISGRGNKLIISQWH